MESQPARRQRLREKLHTLRWTLIVGSGVAFAALFSVIAPAAVSAANPSSNGAQPAAGQADEEQSSQPAPQQPSYRPPVSYAQPSYQQPVLRSRRS